MLKIFNLSFSILVSQEPLKRLCSPKDIVTESCFEHFMHFPCS